jgi:hypothetical protein
MTVCSEEQFHGQQSELMADYNKLSGCLLA